MIPLPSARRRLLSALDGVRGGVLHLTLPDGARHRLGAGDADCDLHLHDWSAISLLRRRGLAGLGQAHAAGLWDSTGIEALVTLLLGNRDRLDPLLRPGPAGRLWAALVPVRAGRMHGPIMRGPMSGLLRGAMPGNEFFQHWLDPGMAWSTGLFDGDDDLDRSQRRKNDRLLDLTAGCEDVLEADCGWGSFAEHAVTAGRRVTALAATPAQKGYAEARLDGRAAIRLGDLADAGGRHDAIVAIEPAVRDWAGFLPLARSRLSDGGRLVLQVVTVPDAEYALQPGSPGWGGHHTSPAILSAEAAKAGLVMGDAQSCGPDAMRTRRLWAGRLTAARDRLHRLGYDAPTLRGWEFGLQAAAARFALGLRDVTQVTLMRSLDRV